MASPFGRSILGRRSPTDRSNHGQRSSSESFFTRASGIATIWICSLRGGSPSVVVRIDRMQLPIRFLNYACSGWGELPVLYSTPEILDVPLDKIMSTRRPRRRRRQGFFREQTAPVLSPRKPVHHSTQRETSPVAATYTGRCNREYARCALLILSRPGPLRDDFSDPAPVLTGRDAIVPPQNGTLPPF